MVAAHNADPVRYVYGWGRTKHLPGPGPGWAMHSPGARGVDWTLCGVSGGNPLARPHLPVCKSCLRAAAKAQHSDGPVPTGALMPRSTRNNISISEGWSRGEKVPAPRRFRATVVDVGGGEITLVIHRDTGEYPEVGSDVELRLIEGPS